VKDRIGLAMIEAAEQSGALKPGGVIVEGTSGNTGVGLAIAAALAAIAASSPCPTRCRRKRCGLLRAYGAEVVVTPTAGAGRPSRQLHHEGEADRHDTPGAILANQHYNQVNPEAHYQTTGPEIWQQTGGR
jgi:cystathionine beta-synthase